MKHLSIKCLAVLLIALLLAPAALAKADVAPVEAIDDAVPEADSVELDSVELDSVELDADAELLVEDGFASGESYQAELSSYEAADGSIPIDEAHFPDPAFRKYVSDTYGNNGYFRNGHQTLLRLPELGIASLRGIEYFTDLEILGCGKNPIASLDVSMLKNLKELYCEQCGMTSLNVRGCTSLGRLDCAQNQLTSLDLSGCNSLYSLEIWQNQLTSLSLSGCQNLDTLVCQNNQLTSLDLSAFPALGSIECSNNALTSLNVTGLSNLRHLHCAHNQLTALDLTGCAKIDELYVDHNAIASVNIDPCTTITQYWQKLSREVNAEGGYVCLAYYWLPTDKSTHEVEIHVDSGTKVMHNGKAFSESDAAALPAGFTEVAGKANATVTVSEKSTAAKTTATVAAAPGAVTQLDFGGAKATKLKSSDKKIATVNSKGVVTFKKAGKVKITYSIGKKTCTVVLKVTDPTLPKSVSLSMTGTNAAKVGEKVTLTATLNEGAKSGIQWTTSDKKIATVKGGVVTFKKAGKVTITATTKRGNKKAKVKFTVTK